MTARPPAASGADTSADAYEELRKHLLVGSPPDNHAGLLLLRREGLAAWMARRAVCPVSVRSTATPRPDAPRVTDELQAGVVHLLASMALADRQEMSG